MLLEFERIEGLRHWERELDQRGLTALIPVGFGLVPRD